LSRSLATGRICQFRVHGLFYGNYSNPLPAPMFLHHDPPAQNLRDDFGRQITMVAEKSCLKS